MGYKSIPTASYYATKRPEPQTNYKLYLNRALIYVVKCTPYKGVKWMQTPPALPIYLWDSNSHALRMLS